MIVWTFEIIIFDLPVLARAPLAPVRLHNVQKLHPRAAIAPQLILYKYTSANTQVQIHKHKYTIANTKIHNVHLVPKDIVETNS